MMPKISNHKTDIAAIGEPRVLGYYPFTSKQFKEAHNITISGFANELSSFDKWSFPKEIQILAVKLKFAFVEWKIANKEKNPEKTKNLKQKQYDLFVKISKKIKKWYDEILPENIKNIYWVDLAENATTDPNYFFVYSSVKFQINKFYFISRQAFDYLLPE